jgi:AraC-like DNA-binding protein
MRPSAVRIPLSRAGLLFPFLEILDRIGAPTDRGLERHNLPAAVRENPEMLVSTRARAAFLGDMARREGITEFGWRATRPQAVQRLSPGLDRTLRRSPTLLQALETVPTRVTRESTHVQVWLEDRDDGLFFCHRDFREFGEQEELTLLRTAVMLSIVQLFTGPDWVPTDCAFAIQGEIGPVVREELGDTRIRRAPDCSWMRLPRSILPHPPRARVATEAGSGADRPEPALDLAGSLVRLLRPYLPEGAPTIRDAASLAGTSVRSLQRALTHAGTSFTDVLQMARLEAARELFQQPDIKIVDVAHETGFSDHAHFVRFFRRLAGMTPRDYRATLTSE